MSRITNILDECRDMLADTNKSRYSDDMLIRYLNKAIRKVCLTGNLIKAKSFIKIETNTAEYDLSNYATKIDRIEYIDKDVKVLTSIQLDALDSDWHNTTGDKVLYTVMDNTNKPCKFLIYPKITDNTLYNIENTSLYGGITDIIVTDELFEVPLDTLDTYSYKYLTVYYTKKPDLVAIDTLDIDIEFDDSIDDSLILFVTGFALRNDSDTQNIALSEKQLQLFDVFLTELAIKQSKNNNSLNYKEIPYRGFI